MQHSFSAWHKDRQRKLQTCFASFGVLSRYQNLGGKPPAKADPTKDGKDEDKKEQTKKPGERVEEKEHKPGHAPLSALLKEKQEELSESKPEKPPAARIVAYSDSEGEDEPFRLTRRRKKKNEGEQTEAEEEKEEAPSTSTTSAIAHALPSKIVSGERHIMSAARSCARRGFTKMKEEAGWNLLLQFVLLWFFRRWKRKPAERFELLTLAISLPDALCSFTGRQCCSTRLPRRVQNLVRFAESWARPSALFQLEGLMRPILPKKKRRRILTTISQSVRVFQEAEMEVPSPSSRRLLRTPPRMAADCAAMYKVELAEMKRILDSQGAKLPADRFDETNAELMRFATSAGLLQAESPEEKAHAIEEGAHRVMKTMDWLRKHRFMPPQQLKEWHHMVRWQGTDTEGWPILVIKIAKACAECQGEAADSVADAILGQMQRAMTEVFSNKHGPDKLVVIMDASGANSLQAARNVTLFKQVSVMLNKHFPYRLHQLFVVDLPPQLRWVLATLKPLLHPLTKEKIRIITMSDPALPLPANLLQSPRSESSAEEVVAKEVGDASKSRRVSIPELPVSSTSPMPADSRPERSSIPALPSAEESRPRRRVRILELPFREFGPKPSSRQSFDDPRGAHSPGSILRPALKRSMSVGLIGIQSSAEEEAVREPGKVAQQVDASSRLDDLDADS